LFVCYFHAATREMLKFRKLEYRSCVFNAAWVTFRKED